MIVRFRLAFVLISVMTVSACSREAAAPAAPADVAAVAAPKAVEVIAPVAESVDVFSIKLGDCLSDSGEDESVLEMQKLDCMAPHVYEVYHVFELPAGAFPGDAVVDAAAEQGCKVAFAAFVGKTYDQSKLEMQPLTPQEGGWKEKDDREVICMLVAADEAPRTGSARGTGI